MKKKALDCIPYQVSVTAMGGYDIALGRERVEEVREFKYLGTVLFRHGEILE